MNLQTNALLEAEQNSATGSVGPTGPNQSFVATNDHQVISATNGNDSVWGSGSEA